MSFRKKIDMLLKAKKLERLSINKIEQDLRVDGTIYKNYKADTYPKDSELISELIRKYRIKQTWWNDDWATGSLDMFDENHTQVNLSTNSKEKYDLELRETFYRDLIENNEEYSLLPKAVLRDYKIVPDKLIDIITQTKDQLNKELEKKNELIIASLENRISKLESEKQELLRQIATQNKTE